MCIRDSIVTGDIYVWENDSLIIEPGVEVLISGLHVVSIRGYLYAVGTVTDSIVFHGLNTDQPGNWNGLTIDYNYNMPGPDGTLSHFRIDGGGNNYFWPQAGLRIQDRYGNISISHGLLTNTAYHGIIVSSMEGTSTDSSYVTLSNILVDGTGADGLVIQDNYYTVLKVEHVRVTDAYYQGIYVRNNYYSDIDLKSVYVTNGGCLLYTSPSPRD